MIRFSSALYAQDAKALDIVASLGTFTMVMFRSLDGADRVTSAPVIAIERQVIEAEDGSTPIDLSHGKALVSSHGIRWEIGTEIASMEWENLR